eukprot:6746329-Prymnesium_polylepis.1
MTGTSVWILSSGVRFAGQGLLYMFDSVESHPGQCPLKLFLVQKLTRVLEVHAIGQIRKLLVAPQHDLVPSGHGTSK